MAANGKSMKSVDRIIGMVMTVFGLLCLIEAYRIWNGWDGTGIMALIVGGIFIAISVIFLVFPSPENTPIQWPSKKEWFSIGIIGGPFALYIIFMNWLGYAISTWLFLAVIARYISPTRITIILIWTGGVAIGTYIVFKKYLMMYLPGGFLGI